jgi:hypothetical protein
MRLVLVIALLVLQNLATTGGDLTLQGTVSDPSKALVPAVIVSLRNPDGLLWVSTNESGDGLFPSVAY